MRGAGARRVSLAGTPRREGWQVFRWQQAGDGTEGREAGGSWVYWLCQHNARSSVNQILFVLLFFQNTDT